MTGSEVRWLHVHPDASRPEFRMGRSGGDVLAEWVGQVTLRADIAGTGSELIFAAGVERPVVENRLRGKIAALLGHLRGQASLHASSVARGDVAVAFIGDSGAGKSTIAAQLCRQPEVSLLSDDLTSLSFDADEVTVSPTDSGHLLRPDVALALGLEPHPREKTWAPARTATKAARLAALVALVFDDSVATPFLRRVHGAAPFVALNRSLVRFVLDEPEVLRRDMDRLARIAEGVPVYELVRARDMSQLPPTARAGAHLLSSLAGGSV